MAQLVTECTYAYYIYVHDSMDVLQNWNWTYVFVFTALQRHTGLKLAVCCGELLFVQDNINKTCKQQTDLCFIII